MNITMQGKYQTKGDLNTPSKPVRILAIDRITPDNPSGRKWPVVGLYTDGNGAERQASWSIEGEFDSTYGALDLVPVPTKHEGWMVLSSDKTKAISLMLGSRESAQEFSDSLRDAWSEQSIVVRVTWED